MAQRLVLIAIDGSDNSEKAFQCMGGSTLSDHIHITQNTDACHNGGHVKNRGTRIPTVVI